MAVGPEELAALTAVVDEWLERVFGPHGTEAEFADPRGDSIYQDIMYQGYLVGTRRGAQLSGLGTPAFIPNRNSNAVRNLITGGFRRLSAGGIFRLGQRVIDSSMSIVADGLRGGLHPTEIARTLRQNFDHYKKWEFLRLARTEVAEAHIQGEFDELRMEGFTERPGVEFPTYHPNCGCSVKVAEDNTLIPDIPVDACPICQAHRVD